MNREGNDLRSPAIAPRNNITYDLLTRFSEQKQGSPVGSVESEQGFRIGLAPKRRLLDLENRDHV